MSLQTQLNSFVLRVAEEFNTVKGRTGTLTALTTTDKSSLVAAINELKAAIAAVKRDLFEQAVDTGLWPGAPRQIRVTTGKGF